MVCFLGARTLWWLIFDLQVCFPGPFGCLRLVAHCWAMCLTAVILFLVTSSLREPELALPIVAESPLMPKRGQRAW
eukprot:3039407-Rhodomonas_salina.2